MIFLGTFFVLFHFLLSTLIDFCINRASKLSYRLLKRKIMIHLMIVLIKGSTLRYHYLNQINQYHFRHLLHLNLHLKTHHHHQYLGRHHREKYDLMKKCVPEHIEIIYYKDKKYAAWTILFFIYIYTSITLLDYALILVQPLLLEIINRFEGQLDYKWANEWDSLSKIKLLGSLILATDFR